MSSAPLRVYVDGIWDLFHAGHAKCLENAKKVEVVGREVVLIAGVVGDAIAEPYKRKPIICEQDRATIVRAIRWVDEVVVPSPLVITEEYVKEHRIDLIVHGFCDERDKNNFYKRHSQVAELEGLELREIPYTSGVSTSQLIAQLSKL